MNSEPKADRCLAEQGSIDRANQRKKGFTTISITLPGTSWLLRYYFPLKTLSLQREIGIRWLGWVGVRCVSCTSWNFHIAWICIIGMRNRNRYSKCNRKDYFTLNDWGRYCVHQGLDFEKLCLDSKWPAKSLSALVLGSRTITRIYWVLIAWANNLILLLSLGHFFKNVTILRINEGQRQYVAFLMLGN